MGSLLLLLSVSKDSKELLDVILSPLHLLKKSLPWYPKANKILSYGKKIASTLTKIKKKKKEESELTKYWLLQEHYESGRFKNIMGGKRVEIPPELFAENFLKE